MRGILIALVLCTVSNLIAAPQIQRRYEYDDLRGTINDMQHEISNNQVEIKIFEERLGTLDATLESIRTDLQSIRALQKDKQRYASLDADAKLGNLDVATKGVVADLKVLKNQLNETTGALGLLKGRLGALEKVIESQNQNIDALQTAMRMLTEALQIKEGLKPTKSYTVKSGDALEKIARANQMTIDEIKELNGLTSAKIIVGQKLLVYDK